MRVALLIALILGGTIDSGTVRSHPSRTIKNPTKSGLALHLPFTTAGCYATGSIMGTKGETITFTRATTKRCFNGSTLLTCQANELCVEDVGAYIELPATNYVLNSGTHPKTSQATGTLGTGSHAAWHTGTGTMTLVAGTAVVTGLSCSAVSAGTVCTFSVTTGGTMTITTTSGTTFAQVENSPGRSSQIDTAAAAVTRNADELNVTNPLSNGDAKFCFQTGVTTIMASTTGWIFATGNGSSTNDVYGAYQSNGTFVIRAYGNDGAGAFRQWASDGATNYNTATRTVQFRYDRTGPTPGTAQVFVDGSEAALPYSLAGTATQASTAATTPLRIGARSTTSQLTGRIKNFKVYRSYNCQ